MTSLDRPLFTLWLLFACACQGAPLYAPGAVRRGEGLRSPLEPPAQTERQFWRVEPDVKLFHFADGSGRTALVLHGGPGIPGDLPWPGLRRVSGFAFHHFHQRGCGRSTRPFDAFSRGSFYANMKELERTLGLGAQIADVERIRRILGEERLVLVGHSFGALLAALYAAEFPDRVSGLVLESPADLLLLPPETGGLYAQVEARLPAEQRPEFRAYLKRYLDFAHLFERTEADLAVLHAGFGRYFAAALRANGVDPGPLALDAPPAMVGGFMPQALYLSMGRKHDWRRAVAQVRAPVLVLHGERDVQPLSATRAFAKAFPSAELRVVAGASHFGHLEQPAAYAEAVGAFLSGIGR